MEDVQSQTLPLPFCVCTLTHTCFFHLDEVLLIVPTLLNNCTPGQSLLVQQFIKRELELNQPTASTDQPNSRFLVALQCLSHWIFDCLGTPSFSTPRSSFQVKKFSFPGPVATPSLVQIVLAILGPGISSCTRTILRPPLPVVLFPLQSF